MHLIRRRARARDDERGAVAILVAASLVVLCMGCAMAVDLGNVGQLHRHAQYTVENAAISGADLLEQGNDTLSQVVTATEGYVNENWATMSSSAWDTCPSSSIPTGFSAPAGLGENCITFNGGATAISVAFPPQPVPFSVARLSGFTSGVTQAQATAVLEPGTSPCALCLLGPAGLTLNDIGNGTFDVTDCQNGTTTCTGTAGITANSNGTPAAQINSNSGTITAPQINLVGSYSQKKPGGFTPTPTTGVSPVPDPLGDVPVPTPATTTVPSASYSCNTTCGILPSGTYGNISLGGNSSLTIPPGNYSSINVIGGGTLTLETGNYFITGPFSVGGTGGASVQEAGGVMLYFTCSSTSGTPAVTTIVACASGGQSGGSLSLSGTGELDLQPQSTGPYAGLTVFYDRNNNAGMTLNGTPNLTVSGTIYAKDSALSLSGTVQPTTINSLIIVNSASINGNGNLTVNYDATQNVAPPGAPYLCSTTANNC